VGRFWTANAGLNRLVQPSGWTIPIPTIGAFAAKAHLSELLDQVERGEEIIITRRGKTMARLSPIREAQASEAASATAQLRALRQETTLAGLNWRNLRDTGRR